MSKRSSNHPKPDPNAGNNSHTSLVWDKMNDDGSIAEGARVKNASTYIAKKDLDEYLKLEEDK